MPKAKKWKFVKGRWKIPKIDIHEHELSLAPKTPTAFFCPEENTITIGYEGVKFFFEDFVDLICHETNHWALFSGLTKDEMDDVMISNYSGSSLWGEVMGPRKYAKLLIEKHADWFEWNGRLCNKDFDSWRDYQNNYLNR